MDSCSFEGSFFLMCSTCHEQHCFEERKSRNIPFEHPLQLPSLECFFHSILRHQPTQSPTTLVSQSNFLFVPHSSYRFLSFPRLYLHDPINVRPAIFLGPIRIQQIFQNLSLFPSSITTQKQ